MTSPSNCFRYKPLELLVGLSDSGLFSAWIDRIVERGKKTELLRLVGESLRLRSLLTVQANRKLDRADPWKWYISALHVPEKQEEEDEEEIALSGVDFDDLDVSHQKIVRSLINDKLYGFTTTNMPNICGNQLCYRDLYDEERINGYLSNGFGFLLFMNAVETRFSNKKSFKKFMYIIILSAKEEGEGKGEGEAEVGQRSSIQPLILELCKSVVEKITQIQRNEESLDSKVCKKLLLQIHPPLL